eukprot:755167-Hanusia_phi.AAC.6
MTETSTIREIRNVSDCFSTGNEGISSASLGAQFPPCLQVRAAFFPHQTSQPCVSSCWEASGTATTNSSIANDCDERSLSRTR